MVIRRVKYIQEEEWERERKCRSIDKDIPWPVQSTGHSLYCLIKDTMEILE